MGSLGGGDGGGDNNSDDDDNSMTVDDGLAATVLASRRNNMIGTGEYVLMDVLFSPNIKKIDQDNVTWTMHVRQHSL